MIVKVISAYSEYKETATILEEVCVDGLHHATRVVENIFPTGDCYYVVTGYRDLTPCDGSCGVEVADRDEEEMFQACLAKEVHA